MDLIQICIGCEESTVISQPEAVPTVEKYFDREPDSDIRSHCRVEREKRVFRGYFKRSFRFYAAIENRTPIFAFPKLQVRRVLGSPERIALWVNQIQAWSFAIPNLSA
jgi:hypothetical protein